MSHDINGINNYDPTAVIAQYLDASDPLLTPSEDSKAQVKALESIRNHIPAFNPAKRQIVAKLIDPKSEIAPSLSITAKMVIAMALKIAAIIFIAIGVALLAGFGLGPLVAVVGFPIAIAIASSLIAGGIGGIIGSIFMDSSARHDQYEKAADYLRCIQQEELKAMQHPLEDGDKLSKIQRQKNISEAQTILTKFCKRAMLRYQTAEQERLLMTDLEAERMKSESAK